MSTGSYRDGMDSFDEDSRGRNQADRAQEREERSSPRGDSSDRDGSRGDRDGREGGQNGDGGGARNDASATKAQATRAMVEAEKAANSKAAAKTVIEDETATAREKAAAVVKAEADQRLADAAKASLEDRDSKIAMYDVPNPDSKFSFGEVAGNAFFGDSDPPDPRLEDLSFGDRVEIGAGQRVIAGTGSTALGVVATDVAEGFTKGLPGPAKLPAQWAFGDLTSRLGTPTGLAVTDQYYEKVKGQPLVDATPGVASIQNVSDFFGPGAISTIAGWSAKKVVEFAVPMIAGAAGVTVSPAVAATAGLATAIPVASAAYTAFDQAVWQPGVEEPLAELAAEIGQNIADAVGPSEVYQEGGATADDEILERDFFERDLKLKDGVTEAPAGFMVEYEGDLPPDVDRQSRSEFAEAVTATMNKAADQLVEASGIVDPEPEPEGFGQRIADAVRNPGSFYGADDGIRTADDYIRDNPVESDGDSDFPEQVDDIVFMADNDASPLDGEAEADRKALEDEILGKRGSDKTEAEAESDDGDVVADAAAGTSGIDWRGDVEFEYEDRSSNDAVVSDAVEERSFFPNRGEQQGQDELLWWQRVGLESDGEGGHITPQDTDADKDPYKKVEEKDGDIVYTFSTVVGDEADADVFMF